MKMTDLTPRIPDLLPESASDLLSYTTLMMTQEEVSENAGEGKMGAEVWRGHERPCVCPLRRRMRCQPGSATIRAVEHVAKQSLLQQGNTAHDATGQRLD